jgi:hypothetical protein
VVFGAWAYVQSHTNARLDRFAETQVETNKRLDAGTDRLDRYIRGQLHQRDLEDARACVVGHVRYDLFKQLMDDLVGPHPEVWARYPQPPCDRAAAQAVLDKG